MKSKDGNTVTLSEDSDIDVGGSLDGLDVDGVDIPLFFRTLLIFSPGPFSFKRFLFVNRPFRDS